VSPDKATQDDLNGWKRCADGMPAVTGWYWIHIKDAEDVKPVYWYDDDWWLLMVLPDHAVLQAMILNNVEHWAPMEGVAA